MKLQYLGTATIALELGDLRLLTDPAFDPPGSRYDFGTWYTPRSWFASEKTYTTPASPEPLDAILVSHDHHADNLDLAGRKLVAASTAPVITTVAAARRLAKPAPSNDSQPGEGLGIGARAVGLAVGATTTISTLSITATPALHGPSGTPRIHEVIGFLLESPGQPTVWISGDTVMHPELHAALSAFHAAGKRIDVAVVHCGAVRFPKLPVLGNRLFTFDAAQAIEAVKLIEPDLIVPIHRSGWTHFRQPEDDLRKAFDAAGLATRTRFLELGETLSL